MDNIRHLSLVRDSGEISLEKEVDIRREGDEDRPLHHPSHPIHLLTLQRESLGDRNIPIKREEGDIHLLRLYRTRKSHSPRRYLIFRL